QQVIPIHVGVNFLKAFPDAEIRDTFGFEALLYFTAAPAFEAIFAPHEGLGVAFLVQQFFLGKPNHQLVGIVQVQAVVQQFGTHLGLGTFLVGAVGGNFRQRLFFGIGFLFLG